MRRKDGVREGRKEKREKGSRGETVDKEGSETEE